MHKLNVDVLAHEFTGLVIRSLGVPFPVEMKLVNDRKQACAAENLLGDTLQPVLQIFTHIGSDIVFGHGGRFNQDQRGGLIERGQNPACPPDEEPSSKKMQQEMHVPAARYVEVAFEIQPR